MIESLARFDADFANAAEMATAARCPNGFAVLTFPCQTRKTFRLYTKKANATTGHKGKRLAAILIGPDGSDEFEDFGFITDAGIEVWNGAGNRLRDYADILWSIIVEPHGELARSLQPLGYTVSLEKRCLVCNRNLTPGDAWRRGINPHCEKKWADR